MRVVTIGRQTEVINQLLAQEGMTVVESEPEVVVTYGGDGTLLLAERLYPGVPKLPIRHDSICKNCIDHDTTHAIKALARDTISRSSVTKLMAEPAAERFLALNEFSLHHLKPNQAIRFSVQINDEPHIEQAIGDCLVVATVFGSHAYYRSITASTFRLGIGIAFNNTTEAINHLVVRETDRIRLKIVRGPAALYADNDDQFITLAPGREIVIGQSVEKAVILGLDYFRCPDCDQQEVPLP